MLNKELLLYLLPIHIIIDLGTGVGDRVYLKGWRGKLTWVLVEEGQVVFIGDRGGIDD